MAKIAQLHNGTQIHFPDDTSEEDMDAAVHHHMAFAQALTTAHGKEAALREERERNFREMSHKTKVIASAAHVEATGSVAKAVNELMGPISGLADTSEHALPQLVMAIDGLSNTILKVGAAIVHALSLDKELHLDSKGKPYKVTVAKNEGRNS